MRRFFLVLIPLLLVFSCKKQETTPQITPSASTRDAKYYTNLFAYNTMNPYYLWRDTMVAELEDWNYTLDPVEKVASLRYKEGGTLVDRWTQLMEDYTPFQSSVTGNGKSFGMDFVLLRVKDSQDKAENRDGQKGGRIRDDFRAFLAEAEDRRRAGSA